MSAEIAPFLTQLPDIPRWVEARGFLLAGRGKVIGQNTSDFLVAAEAHKLLCVVGKPAPQLIIQNTIKTNVPDILVTPESAEQVGAVLPDWQKEYALIHTLKTPVSLDSSSYELNFISIHDLATLPDTQASLRAELMLALDYTPIAAAFVDGRPVSFCYAGCETETLWDISVDTLPAFRRRGYAAAAAHYMIDHMQKKEKNPVWGALQSNLPSLKLAEKLGFMPVDKLVLFSCNPD